eukprot:gb/GEZJ01001571.1/.p1 GENE.gb/GEZJ01001571.1/~~gb/GEZJ01001571.1/.p1  ORF type:complete len:742 (+),score=120.85 gb/GEZJ01001571.1/:214-2226(+)
MTHSTDQPAGDVPPPKRRKVDDDRPSSPLNHPQPPQNGQADPLPPPPPPQYEPPKDGAPQDDAPQDDAPQVDAPQDAAPQDAAPQDAAPQDAAPQGAAPKEAASQEAAPQEAVPQEAVPQYAAPQDAAPQDAAPQDAASQDNAPRDHVPPDDDPSNHAAPDDAPPNDAPHEAQPPPPPQETRTLQCDPSPPPFPAESAPSHLDPLDDVRPPRRQEIQQDEPDATVTQSVPMDSLQMPPTGLTPEVDAVLAKIFASGLFERKDVDGRALDFLASVSPQLALAALEDIQRRDFSTVRNKPAFIMSIFKRVVNAGGSLQSSGTGPTFQPTSVPASALAHLPPSVSDALQRVFQSGVCHPSQFDDRAMDILVDLAEPDAVRALSEFAAMEPGRVRNPSAFWMGLARKYKGHSRAPGGRAGPSYDGAATAVYGNPYDGYDARRPAVSSVMLEQRLDELAASGHLPRNALDDRAMDALRRLPEQDALGVLAELPEPARVRNMSAYVMGLCKKFAAGEARSLSQRGNYNIGAYSGYGGYGGYSASGYGGYGGYGHASTHAGYAAGYGAPGGYASQYGAAVPGAYATHPIDDNSRARETREALETMDPSVRDRFYQMADQGVITESSFDARAISAMQNLRAEDACAALDELAASEPGRIHNISAYFMGLAKKFGRSSM